MDLKFAICYLISNIKDSLIQSNYINKLKCLTILIIHQLLVSATNKIIPISFKSLFHNVANKMGSDLIFTVDGLKYSLGDASDLPVLSSYPEKRIEEYLCPNKGDVFVDIGAHIGKYTLKVAKMV